MSFIRTTRQRRVETVDEGAGTQRASGSKRGGWFEVLPLLSRSAEPI